MQVRRIVVGIGRSFISAGVLILLFVAYQLWGTGLAEARGQERLRSDFLDALEAPSVSPARTATGVVPDSATGTAASRPAAVLPGDAVAIMRIPKIGVEKAVVEGVGVEALKLGPGHYPSTPLPGEAGNAAIAGHRTTYGAPFYRLDELVRGDLIEVTTREGDFTYRVREQRIVLPTQNEVLAPSSENLLTLTTCNPRFSAAQRLIIISELTTSPVAAPAPPAVPPDELATEFVGDEERPMHDEAGVSGASAPKTPAVLWGLAAAAVWVATSLLARRWGRLAAYTMGTPVFLLTLFAFFENFARLLPANV